MGFLCAPCRTLGPILEKVAAERAGAFTLAKLDIDANAVGNALLQAVKSQGIPTVVAFRDGQPVSMFIGAYPEEEVNRFVDELVPSEAELEAEEAQVVEEAGDLDSAEAGYREALEKEPGNHDASIGLARILLARGEDEAAAALAEPLLPDPEAEHIVAQVRVRGWGRLTPSDPLERAKVAAAQGRAQEALDAMLSLFDPIPTRLGRPWSTCSRHSVRRTRSWSRIVRNWPPACSDADFVGLFPIREVSCPPGDPGPAIPRLP